MRRNFQSKVYSEIYRGNSVVEWNNAFDPLAVYSGDACGNDDKAECMLTMQDQTRTDAYPVCADLLMQTMHGIQIYADQPIVEDKTLYSKEHSGVIVVADPARSLLRKAIDASPRHPSPYSSKFGVCSQLD
ncbi:hypothetical protein Ancab_028833 [Ancistrocladus abbreviatus]